MLLLFDNARQFDAKTHPETERQVTADADALQAAMKQTIKDTVELLKKMELAHQEQVARFEAEARAAKPPSLALPFLAAAAPSREPSPSCYIDRSSAKT